LPYILPHYITPLYYSKLWSRRRRLNTVNNTDILEMRPMITSYAILLTPNAWRAICFCLWNVKSTFLLLWQLPFVP